MTTKPVNDTWKNILTEVLGAFLTGKLSFVVADVAVSIGSVPGTPVHFTLASAVVAAEEVFMGTTGEIQVGNVLVSITPAPPAGSSATPEAADIAAAIAATVTPSVSTVTAKPIAAPIATSPAAPIATPPAAHAEP
jgi:hypothetical protein